MAEVTIHLDGEKYVLQCDKDESILEAALREDINAPYSCMAGSCTACMAQLKEGNVEMEYCDALTEDEIKAGKVLTCQAKPRTDKVEVEYP